MDLTATDDRRAEPSVLREDLLVPTKRPVGSTHNMTDDIHLPADAEDRSADHQQAVEACQHAADALRSVAGRCSMKRVRPSNAPSTIIQSNLTAKPPMTATSNRFTSSATDTGTGNN
jgi:hypothetical protein